MSCSSQTTPEHSDSWQAERAALSEQTYEEQRAELIERGRLLTEQGKATYAHCSKSHTDYLAVKCYHDHLETLRQEITMGLTVTETGGGERFLVPEDQYIGRCTGVIDLGSQDSPQFGRKRQALLTFELPECTHVFNEEAGPEPATISRYFTLSLNEKANLRSFLESWRGKSFTAEELAGFDLFNLLGIPTYLTIVHQNNKSGETRAVIKSAVKLPKGLSCPPAASQPRSFSFEEPSHSDFDALPEWIQKQIADSPEYAAWQGGEVTPHAQPADSVDDYVEADIPF